MSDTNAQNINAEQAVTMLNQAIEALVRLGIIQNPQLAAPAPATAEANALLAAAPAAEAPALPKRGAGGRFLPRNGAAPAPEAGPVTKVIKAPKVKKVKPLPVPHLVDDFVKWFYTTPQDQLRDCRCGRYQIVKGSDDRADILYFHSQADRPIKDANNVIGIRPPKSGIGVFNATRIRYGSSSAEQLRPQVAAEAAGAVPVPFENVVSTTDGAGLDLTKLEIVAWSQAENLVIPPVARSRQWTGKFFVTVRHFAGALLMRVEDKYFLFDTDREELSHAGFNPFFTQLPGPATTVAEAYALLMPDEVKAAIAEGKNVKRQGEFFFIPVSDEEFMDAMRKHNTDRGLERTVRRLTDDFEDVGGAHFLWLNVDRAEEVERFIAKCNKHNGGFLPVGNAENGDAIAITTDEDHYSYTESNVTDAFKRVGRSEVVAETTLRGLVNRYLDFSELSEGTLDVGRDGLNVYEVYKKALEDAEAVRELNRKNPRSKRDVPHVELASSRCRRPEDTHMEEVARSLSSSCSTWSDSFGHLQYRGTMAQRFGICYQLRIGARSDIRTQNAHVATGTALIPMHVEEGEKQDIYAIGAVIHSGREHRPLYLPRWHKVVSNTATANWTVSGAVD